MFNNEGDVGPKQKAGPVTYVLKAQPHARFTCSGSDLLHTAQIPLYQSLCGTALPIETLDGRWASSHALLSVNACGTDLARDRLSRGRLIVIV